MSIYLQLGSGVGANIASIGAIILIIAVVLGYWVYKDATGRGKKNAMFWGLGIGVLTLLTLVGGVIGLGVYLYTR